MEKKFLLAHVALGFILFLALFLSILPTLLFLRYFPIPNSHNPVWFVFETLIYIMLLMFIFCTSIMFIPGILFRVFRLAPKEGVYPLDVRNREIFKWILAQGLYGMSMLIGRISALSKRVIIQLFGAKIGKGVIFQGGVTDPYFLEVGDHTIVGGGAMIFTHIADKPRYVLFKRVKIGRCCLLGYNSLIMPGAVLEDYVVVGAYTLVPKDKRLERGLWIGIPARKVRDLEIDELIETSILAPQEMEWLGNPD